MLPGWNNYAYSLEGFEHETTLVLESAWDCEEACTKESKCFSWKWRAYDKRCYIEASVRIGKQIGRTDVISGWRLDRLREILQDRDCV